MMHGRNLGRQIALNVRNDDGPAGLDDDVADEEYRVACRATDSARQLLLPGGGPVAPASAMAEAAATVPPLAGRWVDVDMLHGRLHETALGIPPHSDEGRFQRA